MWTLVLLLFASDALAKRIGGGGSYGRSHGASHSYPHSTGYSGSGTGGHHGYPPSNGYSGNNHGYSSNNHGYPANNYGYSGNNHVPKQTVTHQHNVNHAPKTEVHHHYHNHHYSPPSQIGYGSHSYPVYHGTPPVYIYQYRYSGSRFDNLLTGLALYNLGRMSSHHNSHNNYDADRGYRGAPGEVCKLGIRKSNGDYEETRVDCQLMSSFIWESSPQTHVQDQHSEQKTITSTVIQTINNGTGNSTVTTVTNTTVVDALQAKGESIRVMPGMTCYLIRTVRYEHAMKKTVDCGLLQTYAQSSWRSGADRLTPILSMFMFQMFVFQVI